MAGLQHITDSGDLRKYRTEIPNIIDDLGLNPYEARLYLHYKRVCGANGGECTEGIRGTAKRTKMSRGEVGKARDSLASKGLIEKTSIGQYLHVKIVDIWEINFSYFSLKDRPDINDWIIARLDDYLESVSPRGHLEESVSPRGHLEESVSPRGHLDPKSVSPRGQKKELKNKNQPKEQEITFSSLSSIEIWQSAQAVLATTITRATFDQVISPCEARPAVNGTFTLAAPPNLRRQVQRLEKPILQALNQFTKANELEVIVL